ncbi:hypothetical protein D3C71_1890600 [compost metagenome]
MPDGVLEAQLFPHMEDHAGRIDDAADQDQHERRCRQRRQQRADREHAAPSHGEIEQDRQPVEAAREEALDGDAQTGDRPDADQHHEQEGIIEAALQEGRIGRGDQDEDRGMVEAAQEPLGA